MFAYPHFRFASRLLSVNPVERMKQFDYLVVGSGIAGLSFALKVAPHGRVAIVTKKNSAESNTNYAQGGIASVTSKEDSFELHVRDTLEAGSGLCRENVVRSIVEEGPARIAELIELGMKFSERDAPGENGGKQLDLGKEGGHSKRRILHAKDVTGRAKLAGDRVTFRPGKLGEGAHRIEVSLTRPTMFSILPKTRSRVLALFSRLNS